MEAAWLRLMRLLYLLRLMVPCASPQDVSYRTNGVKWEKTRSVKLRLFLRGGVVFVGLQRLVVRLQRLRRLGRLRWFLGRLQRQLRFLGLVVVECEDVQEMRKRKCKIIGLWDPKFAKKDEKVARRVWRFVYLWLAICEFMKSSKSDLTKCEGEGRSSSVRPHIGLQLKCKRNPVVQESHNPLLPSSVISPSLNEVWNVTAFSST